MTALESSIWLTKFVHVAGIAIWVGGLMAIPLLLVQRGGLVGPPLHRLQRITRFLYVALVSPAAFLAIAAGTALVFLRWTFVEWFTLKLVFVGLLAGLHVGIGLLVLKIFEAEGRLNWPPAAGLVGGVLVASLGILWFVLAKPELDATELAGGLLSPGGLGRALGPAVEPALEPLTAPFTSRTTP